MALSSSKLINITLIIVILSIGILLLDKFSKEILPITEVEVPNLIGMNIHKATIKIIQKNFEYEQPEYSCNQTIDNDIVINQKPFGMQVKPKSKIVLYVSKGKCR